MRDILIHLKLARAPDRCRHILVPLRDDFPDEGRRTQDALNQGCIVVGNVAQMVGQDERCAMAVACRNRLVAHPRLNNLGIGDAVVVKSRALLPRRGESRAPPGNRRIDIILLRDGGPAMPFPVLRLVFLCKLFVRIGEEFLVDEQNITLLADERHARGVLAALVHLHAQDGGHGVLVVNQVAPLCTRLEHDFQAATARRDVHEQDAQLFIGLFCIFHPLPCLAWSVDVVHVHHHQPRQAGGGLLAPAAHTTGLGRRLVECCLEDEGRQAAFQLRITRLAEAVDGIVPFAGSHQCIELSLVNRHRRIYETFLIAKHKLIFYFIRLNI